MAIIAVGLLGLLAVVPVAGYGVQEGNQLSTATFLAEQKLEEIRNAVWTSSPSPGTDCLGLGAGAAPMSMTCTRNAPTPCVAGAACTTFPDEPSVPGHPAYGRTVRIDDCSVTPCGGVTHPDLRLVTVSVSYTPLTGTGVGTSPKTLQVRLLVAKRS